MMTLLMDGWISQGEIRFLALKVFGIIEGYWVDGGFQIVRSLLRALDLVYHVPYVQNPDIKAIKLHS